MARHDTRVIGYFACLSPTDLVCTDTDACVARGFQVSAMAAAPWRAAVLGAVPATGQAHSSRRILRGLQLGAAYAFDKESYARFYPLAQEAGLAVQPAEFATVAAMDGTHSDQPFGLTHDDGPGRCDVAGLAHELRAHWRKPGVRT